MKITSLTLKDFRNHEESDVQLGKLNLIAGRNGQGKTSIQMAIEQALTGRCDSTDKAGKGAADLVRVGTEGAEIQLVASVGAQEVAIARAIPSDLAVLHNHVALPGGIREQQAALYDLIGADEELIHAALNCSRIVGWAWPSRSWVSGRIGCRTSS